VDHHDRRADKRPTVRTFLLPPLCPARMAHGPAGLFLGIVDDAVQSGSRPGRYCSSSRRGRGYGSFRSISLTLRGRARAASGGRAGASSPTRSVSGARRSRPGWCCRATHAGSPTNAGVVPAGLVDQWRDDLERKFRVCRPRSPIRVDSYHPRRLLWDRRSPSRSLAAASPRSILLFQADHTSWYPVIVDEAQPAPQTPEARRQSRTQPPRPLIC